MKVRNPNLNEPNVLDVPDSLVDRHLAAGWVLVDAKPVVEEPAVAPSAEKPARATSKPTTTKPDAGKE